MIQGSGSNLLVDESNSSQDSSTIPLIDESMLNQKEIESSTHRPQHSFPANVQEDEAGNSL